MHRFYWLYFNFILIITKINERKSKPHCLHFDFTIVIGKKVQKISRFITTLRMHFFREKAKSKQNLTFHPLVSVCLCVWFESLILFRFQSVLACFTTVSQPIFLLSLILFLYEKIHSLKLQSAKASSHKILGEKFPLKTL